MVAFGGSDSSGRGAGGGVTGLGAGGGVTLVTGATFAGGGVTGAGARHTPSGPDSSPMPIDWKRHSNRDTDKVKRLKS